MPNMQIGMFSLAVGTDVENISQSWCQPKKKVSQSKRKTMRKESCGVRDDDKFKFKVLPEENEDESDDEDDIIKIRLEAETGQKLQKVAPKKRRSLKPKRKS